MDDRIRAAFDAIHAEEALKEHTKAALAQAIAGFLGRHMES